MPEPARIQDWSSWEAPLRRFAEVTGLVVSAYDEAGVRRVGPFASTRLGHLLVASSLFGEGGAGQTFERGLSARAADTDEVRALFADQLRVHALGLRYAGVPAGSVVFGWVFADYASSIGCERLGQLAGVSGRKLWSVGRLEAPRSESRMATNSALLATMLRWGLQLREAADDLERMSRAREMFLAHVSHELRTPLAAIAMRIELLLAGALDNPGSIRTSLEAMQRNVNDESRLIEDLLEAAVTRTGRFTLARTDTDLTAIAHAACDSIAPTAESRGVVLNLTRDTDEALPLLADASRLQQALWNVISNAVKFTPAGGRVEVRTSRRVDAHTVEVIDEGPGIQADMLPTIFEPFSRTSKNNDRGLGLGLSIARQIVELHGGSITASAAGAGPGTKFTIVLPCAAGAR